MTTTKENSGAENVRWDLSCLYGGPDDPRIAADLAAYETGAKAFRDAYKGKLAEKLGPALTEYARLDCLANAPIIYLFLAFSTDTTDARLESRMAEVQQELSRVSGEYLTFFGLEMIDLAEEDIARQAAKDGVVAKHLPMIRHERKYKPHVFSEAIESALAKRAPYGAGAWSEFHDKVESMLRFSWDGAERPLTEMLHLLQDEADADKRAAIQKTVNDGFKGFFAEYSAQTLYVVTGSKSVEDRERGYPHPMASRNLGNDIPDATVEALHRATIDVGGPLARRFYRLKASILGLPKLRWSDRNAKLPFEDRALVPFDDAKRVVLDAYRSFSPTLADIVASLFERKRVDAPGLPNRRGGAYNYSTILPDGTPETFVFLNYKGSRRDVATIAHECGHAAHGILAARAQGPLMFHAPMAYAETASVFGERTAFEHMRADLEAKGDKKALLALVTGKIDDMMNTVVRQISFSNLERRLHAAGGRKLSVEEVSKAWMDSTYELYGADGEVFTYEDMDLLWAYVSHFHRPFYVYSYAFGEMLTQSLYAVKDRYGEKFEPMYLDLLRAGGTKNAEELLKPFGLDPNDPKFWSDGIASSFGSMLDAAERLCKETGVTSA